MAEHYRRAGTLVLVVNTGAVFGGESTHRLARFLCEDRANESTPAVAGFMFACTPTTAWPAVSNGFHNQNAGTAGVRPK